MLKTNQGQRVRGEKVEKREIGHPSIYICIKMIIMSEFNSAAACRTEYRETSRSFAIVHPSDPTSPSV